MFIKNIKHLVKNVRYLWFFDLKQDLYRLRELSELGTLDFQSLTKEVNDLEHRVESFISDYYTEELKSL